VSGQVRPDAQVEGDAGTSSMTFPLLLVYAFWVLTIFEFERYVSVRFGGPFYRIPTLLAPVLGVIALMSGNKRMIHWPLILFVLLHLGASVLAENAGYARDSLRFMLFMVLLLVSSVAILDAPARMIAIFKLYLLSFVWFAVQGIPSGLVWWHPLLANEDSYGPLMVIAMAFSYFFGLAVSSRRWKWFARATFLLSVLGVVASFARGAALTAGAVLLYILFRSPNRMRTIRGVLLAGMVLLPVAALVVPLDKYIETIQSVWSGRAHSGEGDEPRLTIWQLGWNVFRESPIVGVGASNFGVIASKITPFDASRNMGADPAQLYSLALHNAYLQILAEEGIVGIALWLTMIVAFFRRMRRLRAEDAGRRWIAQGGGDVDLRAISLGLEGAMVGYLGSAFFYNQLYIHWFWSLLVMSWVLVGLTDSTPKSAETKVSRH
jgi:O-antigen ligase